MSDGRIRYVWTDDALDRAIERYEADDSALMDLGTSAWLDMLLDKRELRQEIARLQNAGSALLNALYCAKEELAPFVRTDHEKIHAQAEDAHDKWHQVGQYKKEAK